MHNKKTISFNRQRLYTHIYIHLNEQRIALWSDFDKQSIEYPNKITDLHPERKLIARVIYSAHKLKSICVIK